MALVKCIECGREISDAATKCMYCGYHKKLPQKAKSSIICALFLQAVAVVLLIACNNIYSFDAHIKKNKIVYSDFAGAFNTSYTQCYPNCCSGNIFLTQDDSCDYGIEVPAIVEIVAFTVIIVCTIGVVVNLAALFNSNRAQYCWVFPVVTVGSLLFHSVMVSILKYDMIGTLGYHEIKPGILLLVVIILEIMAAVLSKKAGNKPSKGNKENLQDNSSSTMDSYVDSHGILHYKENNN